MLRRIVRLPCAVADDVLQMEFGCRPYASCMDQRKLEFAFRLKTVAADRSPIRVASARWPAVARKGVPAMHAGGCPGACCGPQGDGTRGHWHG